MRFPRRPWVDVVTKVDLGVDKEAYEELLSILQEEDGRTEGGSKTQVINLSLHEGIGVEELRTEMERMLGDVRIVLDAMEAAEAEEREREMEGAVMEWST